MDKAWGYATQVYDGDTFELDIDSVSRSNDYTYSDIEKVRLADVHAPELNEPGGMAAKRRLELAIIGRRLRIDIFSRDKYGRLIANVDPNP